MARQFRPRGDLASIDGSLCLAPLGRTFDLGAAIAAGEGVVETTDAAIAEWLSGLPGLQETIPGSGRWGLPVPEDSFGERFYDRAYRRRFSG